MQAKIFTCQHHHPLLEILWGLRRPSPNLLFIIAGECTDVCSVRRFRVKIFLYISRMGVPYFRWDANLVGGVGVW